MKKDEKEKYLGPFKVVGIIEQDIKTPLGNEVVQVLYENGTKEIVPTLAFNLLVSPKPVDFTTLQKNRFDYLIPKVIEQMAEVDVRMFELGAFATQLHETITDHYERAGNYLWTGDDKQWIQGFNFMNERTLIETHKILLDIDKDPNGGITKKSKEQGLDSGDVGKEA